MRIIFVLASLVLILSASSPAWAQEAADGPAIQEARRRYTLAEELFHGGNYAGALREWEQVYQLMEGHPNRGMVLFNIGRAYQELNRTREALSHFRRYLAETPESAPQRAEASQIIRELELRAEIEGGSGGGFSPSPVGIAIAGVGAAAMVAGGVLGGVALSQDSSARADCSAGACPPDAHAALVDAHTVANAADGLLWGGLAVAAVGVVLTFVLGSQGNESPQAGAACSADGCQALVRGVF